MTHDVSRTPDDQTRVTDIGSMPVPTNDVRTAIASLGLEEVSPALDSVGAAMAAAGVSLADITGPDPLMRHLVKQQEEAVRIDLERFAASYTVNQPNYCPHCGKDLRG